MVANELVAVDEVAMTRPERIRGGVRERILRVKIGLRYHLYLHQVKLVTGRNMADVVEEALNLYEREHGEGGLGVPARTSEPAVVAVRSVERGGESPEGTFSP